MECNGTMFLNGMELSFGVLVMPIVNGIDSFDIVMMIFYYSIQTYTIHSKIHTILSKTLKKYNIQTCSKNTKIQQTNL